MEKQNSKSYNPQQIEAKIYQIWEKSGYFNPDKLPLKKGVKPFCIIMPPPNANEALHLGHALTIALEDIMIRFNRMRGKKTLWLPGSDHAGFETQVVFEKKLEKEGKSRFDFDRDTLYKMIWDYVQSNKHMMESQVRALGASCDWGREKFTLDPQIIKIVYETFKKLYDEGLVYRGKRVINWCPKHQTSFSELEVKYEEREDKLWYIKYPLLSANGHIAVATTRPETMLGDTAVAVNPKDKHYKKLVGQKVKLPLTNREITIVADNAVEMDFGTGAVKVTPAHDQTDFEIAGRHNLEILEVVGKDGKMTDVAPEPYRGLKTTEAREKIVADLTKQGLIEKEEPYKHSVGSCYKCGRTIEPMLSEQWFIKIKPLAEKAVEAVKKGQTKFISKKYEKIFFHWMKILRDWNISRQIVWGIRIPAWYKKPKKWNLKIYGRDIFKAIANGTKTIETRAGRQKTEGEKYWGDFYQGDEIEFNLADEKTDQIINPVTSLKKYVKQVSHFKDIDEMLKTYKPEQDYPGKTKEQIKEWWQKHPVLAERIKQYGIWAIELSPEPQKNIYVGTQPPENIEEWEQEKDVFDTWFSSGQWPFATLRASQPKDFETFYPTSVMETGWDILFFWVARMLMLGLHRTGKVPFKYIYLHGMIRDKDKQKMSKSKGNVINPLAVVEERGADALRMSLVFGSGADSDLPFSEDKVIAQQRFVNKLWQASKFVLANLGNPPAGGFDLVKIKNVKYSKADKWIQKELEKTTKKATQDIEKFRFHEAAQEIYQFFWHKFCDKTIEDVKMRIKEKTRDVKAGKLTLLMVLCNSLKLLHPFMPFITEEIYQKLPIKNKKNCLMVEEWPR